MAFSLTDYLPYDFANRRHIGPSPQEMEAMLAVCGAESLDALIAETLPHGLRREAPLDWGLPLSEREMLFRMRQVAAKNRVLVSLIGQGYHGTALPPVIQRNILENPAWYTAYTPYQPEISQGRLEALLNYQTMVSDLTGLEIANASLLDEATAAAEAMAMAHRVAKSKAESFFVDENCHPQNIAVIRTRAEPLGIEIQVGDPERDLEPEAVFGAIFQYPGTYGHVRDFAGAIGRLHAAQAVAVMIADPLALTLLKPPGEMGADIAVGSTQRFGVPLGFGGPHAAYMAAKEAYKRAMPGRIVGVSIDARGNKAYRLALQTREQHIRREKATSNVCTAQALLAVMASMYAVFHGPAGLKAIAQRIHRKTVRLARGLEQLGFQPEPKVFFDTLTVRVGALQGVILKAAAAQGINLRRVGADRIGISLDEQTRPATLEAVWRAFGGDLRADDLSHEYRLPEALLRESPYLTHPIFHMNRAEAEMTRYMRRLADRDLALDRAMIPLGSCTMKLNATAEMLPITWPEFSGLHPFVPADQAEGYRELIGDLTDKLCQITGFDAFSMQPNSGAQGEYAGLLTIRAYHRARGEAERDVCLIPTSAHGTNPASAQMAGMQVVVVKAAANGDIDVADFRAKAEAAGTRLAACMITYPSTHGVFEETLRQICEITHGFGGQVYLDGANMNAILGVTRPGDFGADMMHYNLHKTFSGPHGGGGPGAGPVAVRDFLEPYLPSPVVVKVEDRYRLAYDRPQSIGRVRSFFGSTGVLIRAYSYIRTHGPEGLRRIAENAVLNANYLREKVKPLLPVPHGKRCMHEFVASASKIKADRGVTAMDIAKRLLDFGIHAPTVYFPLIVPEAMMIEPTETESKATLDRFVETLEQILAESPELLHEAPHSTAVSRPDEVRAARQPVLKWQ